MINLIEAYGIRNIEGVDVRDIYDAIQGNSTMYSYNKGILTHIPSGRKIIFKCMQKYFKPPKGYYHLTQKDDCKFIKHALEVGEVHSCSECLKTCIEKGLKIKKGRVTIGRDYFE